MLTRISSQTTLLHQTTSICLTPSTMDFREAESRLTLYSTMCLRIRLLCLVLVITLNGFLLVSCLLMLVVPLVLPLLNGIILLCCGRRTPGSPVSVQVSCLMRSSFCWYPKLCLSWASCCLHPLFSERVPCTPYPVYRGRRAAGSRHSQSTSPGSQGRGTDGTPASQFRFAGQHCWHSQSRSSWSSRCVYPHCSMWVSCFSKTSS